MVETEEEFEKAVGDVSISYGAVASDGENWARHILIEIRGQKIEYYAWLPREDSESDYDRDLRFRALLADVLAACAKKAEEEAS